ncbi:hypothetical protein BC830DRAFT_1039037, partial [Chytriomyces sp. MP71]
IQPTADDQVSVRFLLSPVNPADINQIQGTYPLLPTLEKGLIDGNAATPFAIGGNEAVAEIVKVGSSVNVDRYDWLREGSRVVMKAPGFGTWRYSASIDPSRLLPFNYPGVTDLAAATMMVNPCTAYRMLKDFIPLSPGDTILQNGANSAVGQAVVQLARAWGLRSVNIIRGSTQEGSVRPDFDALKKRLEGLGADLVLSEEEMRSRAAMERIKEVSLGRGIQLGLNCVGGKSAANVARVVEKGGVVVTYGGMSREPLSIPTGLLIFNDIAIRGFWMTRWNEHASENDRLEMLTELCRLSEEGKLAVPE